jgi:hypothetical protein
MQKMVLFSTLFSMVAYGSAENQTSKTRKRKCDDSSNPLAKLHRSSVSAEYTNIVFIDKTKSYSRPVIIQTPLFILNQTSEADMMSDQCCDVMESTIKHTFNVNGSLGAYHPQACTFWLE